MKPKRTSTFKMSVQLTDSQTERLTNGNKRGTQIMEVMKDTSKQKAKKKKKQKKKKRSANTNNTNNMQNNKKKKFQS